MKTILSLLAAFVSLVGFANAEMTKDCPITGKGTSRPVDYAKKVSFASAEAKAEFDKSPKTYIEKVAAYNEKDPKCPVTGKKADPKFTSEYKTTVGVCCAKCVAKFTATPDKFIVKALAD